MPLMSAQIQFIDCELSLLHIPLSVYSLAVQPIIRLLLDPIEEKILTEGQKQAIRSLESMHPFLNISITSTECSIVCAKRYAQAIFRPALDSVPILREHVTITDQDYTVIQVDGEGLDAGQRVLELTSPLALAAISIFFITTYFSDYILVPSKSRNQVVEALEQRGFHFEQHGETFVSTGSKGGTHKRNTSSTSSIDVPPQSPPPSNVEELQRRTFSLLTRHSISPKADESIRLVQCASRKDDDSSGSIRNRVASTNGFQMSLIRCLIRQPRLLSVTVTSNDPASVLLEQENLQYFSGGTLDGEELLLGNKEDVLIPITLDLRDLPLDSTGIVCGVAGKLVGNSKETFSSSATPHDQSQSGGAPPAVEMSYLSTARAGTVMVGEHELKRAMAALESMQTVSNGK